MAEEAKDSGPVILERYELMHQLGEGGMGAVYAAKHVHLGSIHAVKALRPSGALTPDQLEQLKTRFLREAKICASVKHPNLVPVTDFGTEQDVPYIVMDFIDGNDLREVLDAQGALGEKRSLKILRDVAGALGALHEKGIIHRDMKPANVMIETKTGRVILTDLGIARDTASSANLTQGILGTPAYMAPEQVMDTSKVGTEGDVYSLGATFYAMLTGQDPFQGDSPLTVIQEARENLFAYGSLAGVAKSRDKIEFSPQICQLLNDMTTFEKDDRMGDMMDVVKRGDEILTAAGGAPTDRDLTIAFGGDMTDMVPAPSPGAATGAPAPAAPAAAPADTGRPPKIETESALAALAGEEAPGPASQWGPGGAGRTGPAGRGGGKGVAAVVVLLLLAGIGAGGYFAVEKKWIVIPGINAPENGKPDNGNGGVKPDGNGGVKPPAARPPTVTAHPADQSVTEGKVVTFSVSATGKGTLKYQWQKNGTDIPGATSASFATPAAAVADSGARFVCIVTNADGKAQTNAATLTVAPSPATIDFAKLPKTLNVKLPGAEPLELVLVPAGRFRIGTPNSKAASETPSREVTITRPFYIGRYEVTAGQYAAFLNARAPRASAIPSMKLDVMGLARDGEKWLAAEGKENHPIRYVPHVMARRFCQWVSEESGLEVKLPGEVEWEYAARGPESRIYPWGNDWEEGLARADGADGPVDVGLHDEGASWCGAHDMSGNVFEWTADEYVKERYRDLVPTDPEVAGAGSSSGYRVIRGGCFGNDDFLCRSASRMGQKSTARSEALGFRVKAAATKAVLEF